MTRQLRNRRRRVLGAVLTLLVLALTSCGHTNLPQDALDPRGHYSRTTYNLIVPVFVVAGVVFVLVQGLILYSVIRFRRRSEDEAPKQVHGNTRLEITWTVLPFLTLLVIAVFTVVGIVQLSHRPKGPNVVEVNVTGHQWWWELNYPGYGVTTANELHVPTHQPVDIALTSVDVIHNFWPPKLAGKIYAIPNHLNHMTLEADEPGVYYGQCAEFCGLSHANMRFRVVAQTPEDFQAWAAANRTDSPANASYALPDPETQADANAGAVLFRTKGCAGCHSITGYSAGKVGPNLTHLDQRTVFAGALFDLNDNNLRNWLRDPPGVKPGSKMPNLNLSEDDITKLIAYLDTLK
ncbi:MAG TPA: cytochrome c oxidase subunit II [Acidimicrobiales bacterium]